MVEEYSGSDSVSGGGGEKVKMAVMTMWWCLSDGGDKQTCSQVLYHEYS